MTKATQARDLYGFLINLMKEHQMTDTHNIKVCSKCGQEKTLDCFAKDKNRKDGFYPHCKCCTKKYREENKRSLSEKNKTRYLLNREQRLMYVAAYRKENNEEIKRKKREYHYATKEIRNSSSRMSYAKNAEYYREYARKKRAENKGAYSKYEAKRIKTDPLFKIVKQIRGLIRSSFKNYGFTKKSRTYQILGCSFDEFKTHIEKQFYCGMSWSLIGSQIHIDHIIPLASAKTEEDVIRLNHFTNLRPLWAKDNLAKGAKMEHLI